MLVKKSYLPQVYPSGNFLNPDCLIDAGKNLRYKASFCIFPVSSAIWILVPSKNQMDGTCIVHGKFFSRLDLLTDYLLTVNLQNIVYQNLMYIPTTQEMR